MTQEEALTNLEYIYSEGCNYEDVKELVLHITDELDRLNAREDWLTCLESAGVDNWSGIDFAYELRDGEDV